MRTRITRIGRTVPASFGGTVRAVWRRALAVDVCHVAPSGTGPTGSAGQALVTLVRDDVPMSAASVALCVGTEVDLRKPGFSAGDPVRFDGGRLVVGRAQGAIVAHAGGAEFYEGRPIRGDLSASQGALEWMGRVARLHRDRACARSALGRDATARCDVLLEALVRGLTNDDAPATERTARLLLGLGPGLTPAGDDMLCGFMLGRCVEGDADSRSDEAMRRVAREARGATSDFSAVHLALAADRRFGEALLDVASACTAAEPGLVRAAVDRCLGEGATSGADALLGWVAGVRSADSVRAAVPA